LSEALPLEPDAVLLSFFAGNDFEPAVPKRKKLHERSYVASLLRYLFVIRPEFTGSVIHGNPAYEDDAPSFSDEKFLEIEERRADIFRCDDDEFQKRLVKTMFYLQEIDRVCSDRGITYSVVIIPDEGQVNRTLQSELRQTAPDAPWDFSRPNRALSGALTDAGIRHLDLLEVFAEASEDTRLYKPNDTHWNIAGNALAASRIADFVQREVLP
jgi:hypothetical protein